MAIGVGTRELVVGAAPPRWMRLRRKPAELPEPASIAIPDEQCFTEAGVLDALKLALATDPAPAGQKEPSKRGARIVLDDFWASHAILRGDFRTLRAREIEEVVLAHFADLYGIEADSVQVRFSVQRGGHAVFASAMSRTLHDGIHQAGATARVDIQCLKLCLPEMLNRVEDAAGAGQAMLLFVADTLLQAVLVEENCWVAYDAQRLFPGDASDAARIAARAEQAFERLANRTSGKREAYRVYLYGSEIDPAPFEGRFLTTLRPAQPALDTSVAHRLMESAR
ncbi:hypothetical protein DLM46_36470 [Paraburkholderia lacunae]|uniref:Uncharacterized protein n=1 Tax=Paraburkholderia lacunae TaxID=2211104 RepID=A0A370MWJ0_9BURK|nr:hypothetical protein DLM46_36470 [Paraburkholderia lacunae]